MKNIFISLVATSALVLSAHAAEVSTKLTGVHLCCPSCVKGVTKAVDGIQGVTATASQDDSTVTLTGPDAATVQKAANALVAAGYFGKSSDPSIKLNADTGAKLRAGFSLRANPSSPIVVNGTIYVSSNGGMAAYGLPSAAAPAGPPDPRTLQPDPTLPQP